VTAMPCVEMLIKEKLHWLDDVYPNPEEDPALEGLTGYEAKLYKITNELYEYAGLSAAQLQKELDRLEAIWQNHELQHDIVQITNWDHRGMDPNDPTKTRGMFGLYNTADGTWTGSYWRQWGYPTFYLLIVEGVSIYDEVKVGPDRFLVGELNTALTDEEGNTLFKRKFSVADMMGFITWTDGLGSIQVDDFKKDVKLKDIVV